jgi:tetratricopeptide (TPR) repeat protein
MTLIENLQSSAQTGYYTKLILNTGNEIEGYIDTITSDSLILANEDNIAGIKYDAIILWQLFPNSCCNEEIVEQDTSTSNDSEDVENENNSFYENEIVKKIDAFAKNDSIITYLHPKDQPITQVPDILKVSKDDEKSIWDSIFSKYQNAIKQDDREKIESLSIELEKLSDQYPECATIAYSTGCLKLKAHNYPDAGKYFDRTFEIDNSKDSLYNAIFCHLVAGDEEKALVDIAKYFYEGKTISHDKLFFEFVILSRNQHEYALFLEIIQSILNEIDSDEEFREQLSLLVGSTIYTLQDTNIPNDYVSDLNTLAKSAVENIEIESYIDIINDINDELKNSEAGNQNEEFNRWLTTDKSEVTDQQDEQLPINEEQQNDNENVDDDKTDFEHNYLYPKFTFGLKKGIIYRFIPVAHNGNIGYGFMEDSQSKKEVHFRNDSIIGNIHLNTLSENIPVLYKSILSKEIEASVDYTASVVISIDMLDNLWDLATHFAHEKDYRSALLEIETILQYDPDNNEAQDKKKRWTNLYNKHSTPYDKIKLNPNTEKEWEDYGNCMIDRKMFAEAIHAFTHISGNPNKSSSWYNKGISYLHNLNYDDAIEHFNTAIEKNKYYYHAIFARGLAYLRDEQFEMALKDFDATLKLRPDYVPAWSHRALAMQFLDNNIEAEKSYNWALLLDENNWTIRAWKAGLLIRMNKIVEAMKIIDDVLENHQPKNAAILFAKGYALQKQNHYSEALDYIEKSLEIEPDNIKALTKRAYVIACLGEYDRAKDAITEAISKKKTNSKSWYYKGVINYMSGNYTAAHEAFKQSLELKPDVSRVIHCKNKAKRKMESANRANNAKGQELEGIIGQINDKFGGLGFHE